MATSSSTTADPTVHLQRLLEYLAQLGLANHQLLLLLEASAFAVTMCDKLGLDLSEVCVVGAQVLAEDAREGGVH